MERFDANKAHAERKARIERREATRKQILADQAKRDAEKKGKK